MKTVTVEQYETSDGQVFIDKAKAEEHETRASLSAEVTQYLDESNKIMVKKGKGPMTSRARSIRSNAIVSWEAWKLGKTPSNVADIKTGTDKK